MVLFCRRLKRRDKLLVTCCVEFQKLLVSGENAIATGLTFQSAVTRVLPVKDATFMHMVGIIEIIAGIIVLSRWTKIGSYIVGLWLIGIAINLVTTGMFYDLAVRDVEIAVGAFALSQLTAVRESSVLAAEPNQRTHSQLTPSL